MYTTNVPITILKEDVEGGDGDDDDDDDDDDEDGWPTSEHTHTRGVQQSGESIENY